MGVNAAGIARHDSRPLELHPPVEGSGGVGTVLHTCQAGAGGRRGKGWEVQEEWRYLMHTEEGFTLHIQKLQGWGGRDPRFGL